MSENNLNYTGQWNINGAYLALIVSFIFNVLSSMASDKENNTDVHLLISNKTLILILNP